MKHPEHSVAADFIDIISPAGLQVLDFDENITKPETIQALLQSECEMVEKSRPYYTRFCKGHKPYTYPNYNAMDRYAFWKNYLPLLESDFAGEDAAAISRDIFQDYSCKGPGSGLGPAVLSAILDYCEWDLTYAELVAHYSSFRGIPFIIGLIQLEAYKAKYGEIRLTKRLAPTLDSYTGTLAENLIRVEFLPSKPRGGLRERAFEANLASRAAKAEAKAG